MVEEKQTIRQVSTRVNLRIAGFDEARRIMDELEARWEELFPGVDPSNAMIEAIPAPNDYMHLNFYINKVGD